MSTTIVPGLSYPMGGNELLVKCCIGPILYQETSESGTVYYLRTVRSVQTSRDSWRQQIPLFHRRFVYDETPFRSHGIQFTLNPIPDPIRQVPWENPSDNPPRNDHKRDSSTSKLRPIHSSLSLSSSEDLCRSRPRTLKSDEWTETSIEVSKKRESFLT